MWYVRSRAKEKVRVNTGITGDGKTWYNQAKHKGTALRGDSIACFNNGQWGHVIYIEYVNDNTVYYTEANVGGTDGVLKKSTVSAFTKRNGYQGCVYLLDYENMPKSQKTAVTTARLNYRETPNGKVAGTLNANVTVTLADDSKTNKDGYHWRKILINNKTYYIADKYLKF